MTHKTKYQDPSLQGSGDRKGPVAPTWGAGRAVGARFGPPEQRALSQEGVFSSDSPHPSNVPSFKRWLFATPASKDGFSLSLPANPLHLRQFASGRGEAASLLNFAWEGFSTVSLPG